MRTLVLAPEPIVPAQSGLPLRVRHLARALSATIDVEVAALSGDPVPRHDEPFEIRHVANLWNRRRALVRALREPRLVAETRSPAMRTLARSDRETVQAHSLPMLEQAWEAPHPIVFDAPDALTGVTASMARTDSRRAMRPIWRFEHRKAVRAERAGARRVAAVTVPSDAEAALFERYGGRVLVVPNGIDVDATPYAPPASAPHVLYVGYFFWRPNLQAALELADDVLPYLRARVPGAALRLVGKEPPAELLARSGPGVEVTGGVPDVGPHLRWAGVTVLPIRAGGGTRIKALEALAAGVPVVATRFAVAGLGLRDGEHVLLAERPRDLAAQAARVLEDRELAEGLSRAGRALVKRRFDWSRVAEPLVELHHELAESAARARSASRPSGMRRTRLP